MKKKPNIVTTYQYRIKDSNLWHKQNYFYSFTNRSSWRLLQGILASLGHGARQNNKAHYSLQLVRQVKNIWIR